MTPGLRQLLLTGFIGAGLWACQVPNEALRAEVVTAVSPDATCNFTVTNAAYSQGFYDPTVDGGQGYSLTMLLRNNMQAPPDDTITLPQTTNINRRAHDLQVTSFDVCWYPADQVDAYAAATRGGEAIDCSTLPEQSARIPVNARVDEGGGLALAQAQVLTLEHLRALFGTSFNPSAIPVLGRVTYADPSTNPQVANGNQAIPERHAYAFTSEDPANLAARSAAWGAKFPTQRNVAVVVQLRANMQLQSGEQMRSNWFSMPINVCVGCMQDYCGPLVEEVCARGPCADGTECLSSGLCTNPTLTCSPVTLYSGARPDFFGQSGVTPCFPAQGFATATPLTCANVGCRATN